MLVANQPERNGIDMHPFPARGYLVAPRHVASVEHLYSIGAFTLISTARLREPSYIRNESWSLHPE